MLATRARMAAAGVTEVAYSAHAVDFDGANDYLTRGADLTGLSDGKEGVLSFWFNWQAFGTTMRFFGGQVSSTNRFVVNRITGNVMRLVGRNTSGTTILSADSNTVISSSGWHHMIMAWDLAAATVQIYLDDSSDLAAGPTTTNDTIDYTSGEWVVGANDVGADKTDGYVADVWFDDAYINIATEANRRKFIDASGKPVDLGSTGQLPTGSSPMVCLNNSTTAGWEVNKGTGGGFTENGALSDAPSSPSD